ncbi:MAG: hypothetical protein WBP12_01825 [Candidatus Saccharimonas sp.]
MELPKFTYQPVEENDDTERWLNEGGHPASVDSEVLTDDEEVSIDSDDTAED